jgi:hypothetical protein
MLKHLIRVVLSQFSKTLFYDIMSTLDYFETKQNYFNQDKFILKKYPSGLTV